jgi:hypothetical protein
MLASQLSRYYDPERKDLPLNLSACTKANNSVIVEPLPALLSVIARCLIQIKPEAESREKDVQQSVSYLLVCSSLLMPLRRWFCLRVCFYLPLVLFVAERLRNSDKEAPSLFSKPELSH